MVAAVLLAGIAQAAHYHRDKLGRPGSVDTHCLLCLYAAGTAAPPAIHQATRPAETRLRERVDPHCIGCAENHYAASYDARGPPIG
jgi:hypothetical protein